MLVILHPTFIQLHIMQYYNTKELNKKIVFSLSLKLQLKRFSMINTWFHELNQKLIHMMYSNDTLYTIKQQHLISVSAAYLDNIGLISRIRQ